MSDPNDPDDPAFADIVGDLLADGMDREQAEALAYQQIAENAAFERRLMARLRAKKEVRDARAEPDRPGTAHPGRAPG
jgi:hypothetical protein